jgi:uncharacterized protein
MDDRLIEKTADFIRQKLSGEGSGHDWWHIYRVWQTARHIAAEEPEADKAIVELGALLHDIADWKFHDGNDEAGPKAAREWLESLDAKEEDILQVEGIIRKVSFKGAGVKPQNLNLETKIVQDADRLDAIGAIGVARAFAYGGHKNREMYNPEAKPEIHQTAEQYKANESSTINHFYEKLLLLKDRMQTKTGQQVAERRHKYMEGFLKEFYAEWNGEI